jgi:hypothetical protein
MQIRNKINLNDGRERLEPAVPIYFLGPRSAVLSEQEELEFRQSLNSALFVHLGAQTDSRPEDVSAGLSQSPSDFRETIAVSTTPNATLAARLNRPAGEQLKQGHHFVQNLFGFLAERSGATESIPIVWTLSLSLVAIKSPPSIA